MENEDIMLLAQLLHAMRELADKLEKAFNDKDFENVTSIKRELYRLQNKVRELT